ncbi:sulfotransferase 4A1-like [Ruditapes philippinarum]|uniref:sulfotransferase 4A1-like n=1 Tax=Ruditapes philippinarum TaxID=129788 RepID=UPI00295B8284|nr:sulfotransferase 4A1-like [Ruditapes philippinarum]
MSTEGCDEKIKVRLREYKGILMGYNEAEMIETMDTREDDIWVCSYPRSGTTLTQQIVWLVMTLDFEQVTSVQLDDRFPQVDMKDDRFPYYRGVEHIEKLASPRMIKCHLHHFLLPEQLRNGKGRIIYIARNPKDVIVSAYNLLKWTNELSNDEKAWNEFLESFVNGSGLYCPWPRHVTEFWQRRNDKNVLFLKYDDVIKDIPQTVRKIARFLQQNISDDDVIKISDCCHIDKMRNNDKLNMSYHRKYKHGTDDVTGGFINKGISGAWKEVLSREEAEKVHQLVEQVNQYGLSFED